MKNTFALLTLLFFTLTLQQAHASEKTHEYKSGDLTFEGFLAKPKKPGNRPGILIIHDWMGLTEKTKEKARALAALGYYAFAADIYGKGVRPNDGKEASVLATTYKKDRTLFRERLNLGLAELQKIKGVDSKKLAAIGFCFGGTGVIELSRAGADLLGAVSFHGGLDSPSPELGKNIKSKLLVLHGADDPYISEKDFKAFESELKTHKVDYQIVSYGGAVHSFTDKTAGTDPSKGAAYEEKADKRSWVAMREFFEELF